MCATDNDIKICEDHENEVPLLFTFKFDGYEYWCPFCNYKSGMFGAGINVPVTKELENLRDKWKEKAKPYLSRETEEWKLEQTL